MDGGVLWCVGLYHGVSGGPRHTIGCISPHMDGGIIEHLRTSCLAESGLRWSYQQDQDRERRIHGISFRWPCRLLVIPVGNYIPIPL